MKRLVERKTTRLMRQRIQPGMTVLDIGANIGFYSDYMADLVGPQGVVHAFEPSPLNFIHLQETVKGRKNIHCRQAAVGEVSGSMPFVLSKAANIDNHLTKNDEDGTVTVPVVSMDDFSIDIDRIDGVKVDVQGGEYDVFLGMRAMIERNQDIWIIFEFWPFGLARAGVNPLKVLDLLEGMGLDCRLIDGSPAREFPIKAENWKSSVEIVAD